MRERPQKGRYRAIIAAICVLLALAGAIAQDLGAQGARKFGHPPKHPIQSEAPVTKSEARAIFDKVGASLFVITDKRMIVPENAIPSGSSPVTKGEILSEMDRLYKAADPYFLITPNPVWYDPSVLSLKPGNPARPLLEHFVAGGFIGRVEPLATSPEDSMRPSDFADAVGVFANRLSDLMHWPDPKYSPYLSGG